MPESGRLRPRNGALTVDDATALSAPARASFDDIQFETRHRLMFGTISPVMLRMAIPNMLSKLQVSHASMETGFESSHIVYYLFHNAREFVRKTHPSISIVMNDNDTVDIQIFDDGPGILSFFKESWAGKRIVEMDKFTDDELLSQLLHERMGSLCGDPNSGLGIGIAIRKACEAHLDLTLETDGRRFVRQGPRMEPVATDDAIAPGTRWTLTVPVRRNYHP